MPESITYIAIGIIVGAVATFRAFVKWESGRSPPSKTKKLKP